MRRFGSRQEARGRGWSLSCKRKLSTGLRFVAVIKAGGAHWSQQVAGRRLQQAVFTQTHQCSHLSGEHHDDEAQPTFIYDDSSNRTPPNHYAPKTIGKERNLSTPSTMPQSYYQGRSRYDSLRAPIRNRKERQVSADEACFGA